MQAVPTDVLHMVHRTRASHARSSVSAAAAQFAGAGYDVGLVSMQVVQPLDIRAVERGGIARCSSKLVANQNEIRSLDSFDAAGLVRQVKAALKPEEVR